MFLSRKSIKAGKIRYLDLSTCLPANLHERVSKIISITPLDQDRFEDDTQAPLFQEYTDKIEKKLDQVQKNT